MTGYELATLAVSAGQLAAGTFGVILVWQGLGQMRRSSDLREKRDDQRQAEAMRALDSQAEAMRATVAGLERQGAALEAAMKGGRA